MLIENNSKYLLKKLRAKAKMYEYNVALDLHIEVEKEAPNLLLIAIGAIGDITAEVLRKKNIDNLKNSESRISLEFSSKFFDSFLQTKFDENSEDYYLLLGSVAYYLCDFVGSSKVLVKKIDINKLDLGVRGLDKILANILQDQYNFQESFQEKSPYKEYINFFEEDVRNFFEKGIINEFVSINKLRTIVYEIGTSLELLLVDCLLAIFIIKMNYSAINLLPKYLDLDPKLWRNTILQNGLVKELWPSQRKLGELGIYNGNSAVIQMPTSSGKTKAISLIIYSSFLKNQSELAVIVAPFRALCREISSDLSNDFKFDNNIKIDELSDILKSENIFDNEDSNKKIILVVTPEKLLYLLRQNINIIKKIGLIIFDESHLFDDFQRGVSYELLVSTIRSHIKKNVQKVFISAVIPNANQLSEWVNGEDGIVVEDNAIKSTEKLIAISDWEYTKTNKYGYLYFLNPNDLRQEEFYVPRLVKISELQKIKREKKFRVFPDDNESNDIAVYYGLNLCTNGATLIFCGRKDSANRILKRIIELEERKYNITNLLATSNMQEINKLSKLISSNYGTENTYYEASLRGVFTHHAGISNGIKISIEYAMKNKMLNFLVCTSTLAQGVNLPIRYLIISSLYQAGEEIRVRDFHNLIGRAGRAGVYTEGSILFSEMNIYNTRKSSAKANWKWNKYNDIVNIKNSENCTSRLLDMIRITKNGFNSKEIIETYYNNPKLLMDFVKESGKKEIQNDFANLLNTVFAIESFLMSYLNLDISDEVDNVLKSILENTFAYFLSNDKEKEELLGIFKLIYTFINNNTQSNEKRLIYSKSLQGVTNNLLIEKFINENIEKINECNTSNEIFLMISFVVFKLADCKNIKKITNMEDFNQIVLDWIVGKSYNEIFLNCKSKGMKIIKRNNLSSIDLYDVIEICDKGVSYSTTLVLTAITELYSVHLDADERITSLLKKIASQLRYGLHYNTSILVYELGFSDRVIAQLISNFIDERAINIKSKNTIKKIIKENEVQIKLLLEEFPSKFYEIIDSF